MDANSLFNSLFKFQKVMQAKLLDIRIRFLTRNKCRPEFLISLGYLPKNLKIITGQVSCPKS
jgi:hypothetical protein